MDRGEITIRPLVAVPDQLIDEVAQVQHEAQLLGARPAGVLVQHAAVGVHGPLGDVLTADEGEPGRPIVIVGGSGDRAADAAGVPGLVNEAVPVLAGRLEPRRQEAACPVGGGSDRHLAARHDPGEFRIARHLDGQPMRGGVLVRRPPGPEDDAVGARIARGDTLRIEVAALTAGDRLGLGRGPAKRQSRADGGGLGGEGSP